jgi:hypothetical protein
MKNKITYLLATLLFIGCSNSPSDKAESSVKSYLKDKLQNPGSYEPINFSNLDTFKRNDTTDKIISAYGITHNYEIENSAKEKVKMTVRFYLDKDLKVTRSLHKSINGNYSSLSGNVSWKFNNYIGNKADAGSEIVLLSLDTIRGVLKYESTADLQGNYKIENVLPGYYFLIVKSKNATDCPEDHLSNLKNYEDDLGKLFGFSLLAHKKEIEEIDKLHQQFSKILMADETEYGGFTRQIELYTKIEKDMRERASTIIGKLPDDVKRKVGIYTGYSDALEFANIRIEEGKPEVIITDFGITCI